MTGAGLPRDSVRELSNAERVMQSLGEIVSMLIPPAWGFIVIAFDFDGPSTTYVSSAEREDVVKFLREMAEKLEQGKVEKPGVVGRLD